ncbi:MFS general substrate transporter [Flagelloscypha sp. PMI_526]|nr:MFS general substrate transporter [Flagelloscypha sp. PMI_526]
MSSPVDTEKQQTRFEEAASTTAGDTEKGSAYANSTTGLDHQKGLKEQERRILRKLDVVILPLTALLYLSAYLDRGNLGNAKLQGLFSHLLGSNDTKYSVCLTMFYVTYIALSIPGTLLAKKWLPSNSIALGAVIWSTAAACMAGAQNYPGVIVCRLFIGIGEALFGQAVALYYSMWYKKDEVGKRLALFIGAGVVSGAFGGLLAYGVQHIKSSIDTWRYLFIIEGVPSFVLAVSIFFFLPSRPDKSNYITEDERTIIHTRLNEDSLGEGHTGIDWNGVKRCLTDPKSYVFAIMYSAMNLCLGSVSGFLPTIIKSLGYSNADAQLYTVPPYAVALVFMTLVASISDRLQSRGIPTASVFAISSIGWIILLTVEKNLHARYFATFCCVIGGYAAIPLIMSWVSNNSGSQSQRATGLGLLNSVGQCLSILASFIFPTKEGPKWIKGFGVNLAFSLFAMCIALGLSAYFRWENRRRDKVEGPPPPKGTVLDVIKLHDLAPGFRYVV